MVIKRRGKAMELCVRKGDIGRNGGQKSDREREKEIERDYFGVE